MTYDPPHRNRPPQQGRSPYATPAEPWQAYQEDDAYPDEVPAAANRRGSYWATAGVGTRSQPGYTDAARGRGYTDAARGPGADQGYRGYPPSSAPDPFADDYTSVPPGQRDAGQHEWSQNHWGADDRSQTYWGGNDYRGAGSGGYGSGGYGSGGAEYEPAGNAYGSDVNGHNQRDSGYHDAAASHDGEQADYGPQASYGDGFDGAPVDQKYAGGNPDDFPGAAEYQGGGGYSGPVPARQAAAGHTSAGQEYSGAALVAPDADVYPDSWQADQARRWQAGRRGTAVCAVTGVLAAAAAIGVSTLAAAFVGPQASPIHAVGTVFIDRPPAVLKNFAAAHFGAHDRTVLLLGMFALIAVLALGIGMLARRAATLGVAGLAGLSLLGAFITITRPESRVSDVLPSVFGCLAGVAALLWLVHASAPVPALRHARGNGSRRAR